MRSAAGEPSNRGCERVTSRHLHRLATRLRDLEAFLTLDPSRWGRRIVNKAIGRAVGQVTRRLYLRRRR